MTRRAGHRPAVATVAAILAAGDGAPAPVPRQLDAGGWDAVLAEAGTHDLVPALWRPARTLGLVEPVPEALVEVLGDEAAARHHPAAVLELAHRRNATRVGDLLDQLATVVDELAAAGVEVVALKGAAHLVGGTWPDPADRSMADLDLLIDPGAARTARRRLEQLGYVATAHPGEELGGHHHLPALRHPARFGSIELHVEPLQRGWRAALGAGELWADAQVVSWRGTRIGVPTAVQAAVVSLVHGYLADGAHYQARVPLRTVHELWCADRRGGRLGPIDWGGVADRLDVIGWASLVDDHRATVEGLFGDRGGSAGHGGRGRTGAVAARARLSLALSLAERPAAARAADRWLRARSSLDEGRLRRHYGTAIEGRWPLRLHHLSRQVPGRRRRPGPLDASVSDGVAPRRPRALLVSPELPSGTGNGLAMRAEVALQALRAVADVTVVVVDRPLDASGPGTASTRRRPPMGRPADGWADHEAVLASQVASLVRFRPPPLDDRAAAASWLAQEASRTRLAALEPLATGARLANPTAVAALADELAAAGAPSEVAVGTVGTGGTEATPFDLVQVVRLRMAPWAEPFAFRPGVVTVLDLDDDEVATHDRLRVEAEARGESDLAEHLGAEAEALGRLADWYAPRATVVTVASPDEVAGVARHRPTRVAVVPNAIDAVPGPRTHLFHRSGRAGGARPADPGELRLLLVGNFTYAPNRWAAEVLVDEVRPALGARSGGPVQVELVGAIPPSFERFRAIPHVRVAGHLASEEELDAAYAAATLVVLPLVPAGGTRIKVLEAFTHRVPVVATPGAVEGLGVVDGVHALVAEGVDDLVEASIRALDDQAASRARVERAWELAAGYDRRLVVGQLRGRLSEWLRARPSPGAALRR